MNPGPNRRREGANSMNKQTTEKPPLRVIGLTTTNFMAVSVVHMDPDPDDALVIIGGDNGQGKTSTLESIWACLGGKPSMLRPIREGQERAEIEIDLGDIKVTRRFWYDKNQKLQSDLKVENGEGAVYRSPQELLDGLLTKFGFDPFDVVFLKPKEQLERFKAALGIDTTALEKSRDEAYEERKLVNREIATLKAKFVGQAHDPDAPDEEVSVAALTEQLNAAHAHNREADQLARDAEKAESDLHNADVLIDSQATRIAEMEAMVKIAKEKLANMQGARHEVEKAMIAAQKIAAESKHIDVDPIEEELDGADQINRRVRANQSLAAAKVEWDKVEANKVALDKQIDAIDAEKLKTVAAAMKEANIAGVSLDEEGVWVEKNGGRIPFSQENTANQIRITLALALRGNPRLRIFRIRDGGALTKPTMAIIRSLAVEFGAQVWLEVASTREDVASGFREVSFMIENGEVAPVLTVAK